MITVDEIRTAALKLPAAERAVLARQLIESLPEIMAPEEWEEAWADELEGRYDEYLRRDVKPIDGEECLKELEGDLRRMRLGSN